MDHEFSSYPIKTSAKSAEVALHRQGCSIHGLTAINSLASLVFLIPCIDSPSDIGIQYARSLIQFRNDWKGIKGQMSDVIYSRLATSTHGYQYLGIIVPLNVRKSGWRNWWNARCLSCLYGTISLLHEKGHRWGISTPITTLQNAVYDIPVPLFQIIHIPSPGRICLAKGYR
jgi:hypothetical protein